MVLFPSQLCKCCIWQGDFKKFCRLLVEIVGNFNQSLTFTLIHLRARVQFHLYINTIIVSAAWKSPGGRTNSTFQPQKQ